MKQYTPVALIILDGWGIREKRDGNAVAQGHTPNHDRWLATLERSILDASGESVGLPEGQMGNSEVGHLNLGAGRIVYQDLTRISRSIRDGSFFKLPRLIQAVQRVKENQSNLHLIGLFGAGGVHSHSDHMVALLELAGRQGVDPILHLITDGRDTPPESSLDFIAGLESYLSTHPGTVASVSGRYYTMDRDRRWPRTELGYRAIALHQGADGRKAPTARAAIQGSHAAGISDEFIRPVAIECGDRNVTVQPGDCLIFYNFRADRMRQLVTAFAFPEFHGFEREFIPHLDILTMTNYDDKFPVDVLYSDDVISHTLAEVLSQHGLRQFHAAETEKYAHVTYFFNGGREAPFPGEARYLEPSPKVATYDLKPEMSANELTAAVLERLEAEADDFLLVNYANPDMVGHTGDLAAAIKAVEAVDACAGRLVEAILAKGGIVLVTADHGNCERMVNHATGKPHTYHTTQPVSLFVIGYEGYVNLTPRGILADVAPTVLQLMGIDKPGEMSGNSLLDL